ncbi:MAG: MmcQ/YjbR family DNA-binding protein [Chitinophagaceae bacterium]|nr:MmcQ/YjbR family DNA-binding protein [Chitinophagaceae bacterium]
MVSIEAFRKIALSFPETMEAPHFENTAFKVNKKIFATLNIKENRATVKLSEKEQDLFCLYDKQVMYPVPNKWGDQGWTHINLKTIKREMCADALAAAFHEVASIKLSSAIKKK